MIVETSSKVRICPCRCRSAGPARGPRRLVAQELSLHLRKAPVIEHHEEQAESEHAPDHPLPQRLAEGQARR